MKAAAGAVGLSDFGLDNGWRGRLERLCEALAQEAALTSLGTTIAYGQLVAALANRLRAAALWQRRPEILEVPIERPIIIVGQMRSGSTRMQRMLACDPGLTFTRFFESWNPLPRWMHKGFDDRIVRGWFALRLASWLNPQFKIIHPASTFAADEEIGIHNIALYGAAFEAQWRIPSFARAGEAADCRPVYEEFRAHLQTIRWLRRDQRDRPWVLKIPQFGQDLRTVLEVFPDARLVVLERDPVSVVGSSASLVHNQMAVQSRSADPLWIGREWLAKTALRKQRIDEGLSRHSGPSVTVDFHEMQVDWRSEMRRVYHSLDMPFTSDVERRMARFAARPSHARLRRHHYDIADFGLCEATIRRALDDAASDPARQVAA